MGSEEESAPTCPGGWARWGEGVSPACCWSEPPRWSPGHNEGTQEVRGRTQEVGGGEIKRLVPACEISIHWLFSKLDSYSLF